MTRIGFADHLFLRMHHGIGFPVYNQFLWWFDDVVQREDLERLRDNLSDGLLARRVVASAIPTARDRWVPSAASHSVDFHPEFTDPSMVRQWADGRIDPDIDPETGLGWQLAATRLSDGGMVLSLVASHMVADGGALIAAFRAANSDSVASRVSSAPGGLEALASDFGDAVEQIRSAGGWLVNAAVQALPLSGRSEPAGATQSRPKPNRAAPERAAAADWTSPHVVAEVDADAWRSTAERWGGTSNSLFVAVLTAASELAGRASVGDTVQWSLPVSDRGDASDTRSNATKIVKIDVPIADPTVLDLRPIRAASKSAFTAFAAAQAAGAAPGGLSQALVQMLPDAVVARVPQPRDGAEGLASNLGSLPDDFTTVAGIAARAVSGRATFAGADADFARSLDGGLTAWSSETGTSVTVTVHAMDPDRCPDEHILREHLTEALRRWGLSARFW